MWNEYFYSPNTKNGYTLQVQILVVWCVFPIFCGGTAIIWQPQISHTTTWCFNMGYLGQEYLEISGTHTCYFYVNALLKARSGSTRFGFCYCVTLSCWRTWYWFTPYNTRYAVKYRQFPLS